MNVRRLVAASLALVASMSPAWSALVSIDDSVYGVGSVTRDTATGLEWLDLTLTTNRTFLAVQGELGLGGEFDGFLHANVDQIEQLWVNAGIPTITPAFRADGAFVLENREPVLGLLDLIGATAPFPGQPIRYTLGVTGLSLTPTPDFQYVATLRWNSNGARATLTDEILQNVRRDVQTGHWLLRQGSVVTPVPEPGTLALLSFGLIAFASTRRKPRNGSVG